MTINHERVTYTLAQLYAEQGYSDEAEDCLAILNKHNDNPEKATRIRNIIKEQKEARLKVLMKEWVACIRKESSG